jgi:hypothetical protein
MTHPNAKRGKIVSEAEFRRMWLDASLTAREIGERLGVTEQAVRCRAISRGLPPRKGGGGKFRKIDPERFRRMWDANVGSADIARAFRVTQPCVNLRAREWGFPKRNCTRWNMVPLVRFLLAETARETEAALRLAEMVDGYRDPRNTGRRAA